MIQANSEQVSRRRFLQTSTAGAAVLAAGTASDACAAERSVAKLKPKSVILFQGDSITDAGRSRQQTGANNFQALGRGYPLQLAASLLADHAKSGLKVYNRGISGHKVPDLAARWDKDTIALKPAVLSILVGVNDLWHKMAGKYDGTVADYESGFRDLLKRTLQELPDVRIVICEPFALRCGAVNDTWFPEFDERRAVAKKLADELKLTFVPFQTIFDEATGNVPPNYWAGDGVHPTLAGHALMAKTWRKVVGI